MAEHETKFVFPADKTNNIIQWLKSRCRADGEFPQGIISSIYYDTIDWSYLYEKINSDFLKTKYRLRWYQKVDSLEYSKNSYFEKKEKIGTSRRKSRVQLHLEDSITRARYLNEPCFMELPLRQEIRELGIDRSLVPAFQISYTRFRFVDILSGARLAVDSNIHIPRINPAMIKKVRHTPMEIGVFEYKSNAMDLPDWLHGVTVFGCRKGSFSKYSTCFEHITGISF